MMYIFTCIGGAGGGVGFIAFIRFLVIHDPKKTLYSILQTFLEFFT